ncbi:hypothetical protein E2C01_057245 [Portunus trituberculatus]|uniref:Uncharacterized protein n=1 Tax=Portunus trituberculatus TaxID=210409 RepID=A0A5B7GSF9_PORTR|nr:hypothetical protein [Portunus trituberculatus]
MYRNVQEEAAGMLAFRAIDMAVFGHRITTEAMLRHARERFGTTVLWKQMSLVLRLIYVCVMDLFFHYDNCSNAKIFHYSHSH